MANNPYYSEEQRRRLQQGKQTHPEARARKVIAGLDNASMRELKDINDNTLETALNTMGIKEGLQSFEEKFKEKFNGFKDKYEQETGPVAEQSPDFVGPLRPPSLTDNSNSQVDNSVTVNPGTESLGKIETSVQNIAESMLKMLAIYKKVPIPLPDPKPRPADEPDESLEDKDNKDENRKRGIVADKMLGALTAIKDTTSSLLSRFIGYSLEAIANFAKWTMIIGSLVLGIDVIGQTIKNWFNDILQGGESSKSLFGSYFGKIQDIAKSIDAGLKNFDMDDLGNSLKDLFIEPLKLLGDTIKVAITEGIGTIIAALGEYTGSETIQDAGRTMKLSALRDKQKSGMEISPEDMMMIREDDLAQQKAKEAEATRKVSTAVNTSQSWLGANTYNQMAQLDDKKKTQAELDRLEAKREQMEIEKKATQELAKQNELLRKDPEALKAMTDEENARNRERVAKESAEKAAQEKVKRESWKEMDRAEDYVDKDNLTKEDVKEMEKLLQSLEEKNNSKQLSDNDTERYRKVLEDWQNKTYAVPESSKVIETPPENKQKQAQSPQQGNTQINQKTVNNTVVQSVQRTEMKPLIRLG
ncbi:hypothetical protein JC221_050 [Yersinia phage JC221]|nr:hypothetical protein JC221_050 [Yersinia phage JC221]